MGKECHVNTVGIVARIGMGVPLSQHPKRTTLLKGFVAIDSQAHVGFVGGRDDGVESRLVENRFQHLHKLHLRGIVEVTAFLRTVGVPEIGN